ncbi:hypothetical protein LIA77_02687 [Sarocladium implicatum]|nr:hypothetical protein LIA77_02687 [Sarocladium implicatum]
MAGIAGDATSIPMQCRFRSPRLLRQLAVKSEPKQGKGNPGPKSSTDCTICRLFALLRILSHFAEEAVADRSGAAAREYTEQPRGPLSELTDVFDGFGSDSLVLSLSRNGPTARDIHDRAMEQVMSRCSPSDARHCQLLRSSKGNMTVRQLLKLSYRMGIEKSHATQTLEIPISARYTTQCCLEGVGSIFQAENLAHDDTHIAESGWQTFVGAIGPKTDWTMGKGIPRGGG